MTPLKLAIVERPLTDDTKQLPVLAPIITQPCRHTGLSRPDTRQKPKTPDLVVRAPPHRERRRPEGRAGGNVALLLKNLPRMDASHGAFSDAPDNVLRSRRGAAGPRALPDTSGAKRRPTGDFHSHDAAPSGKKA